MKYQLSDMVNGPFESFDSHEAAEAALEEIVQERLEDQKGNITETIEMWKDGYSRPTASLDWELEVFCERVENGEDLDLVARESILAFHEIVSVEA